MVSREVDVLHLVAGDKNNFIVVENTSPQKRFHPMNSGDEVDEAFTNKRRRLVKKRSAERERSDQELPTAAAEVADDTRRHEITGNEAAGRFPRNYLETTARRYSTDTAGYLGGPSVNQASLQRLQRENAEEQYGLGRGIPPATMAGRGQLNPHDLVHFQDQLQRQPGITSEPLHSSLIGGDPSLPASRGDPYLQSGRPSAAMLYDQYLIGGQPLRQLPGEPLTYGAQPLGRERGLDMLFPLPPGQTPSLFGIPADVARLPPRYGRGMDPLLPQSYNEWLPEGRGYASSGLDPYLTRGLDPYMDAAMAQRYPFTAAALGSGGLGSQLSLDLERAQLSRRGVSLRQNRGLLGDPAILGMEQVPVNPDAITLYTPDDEQTLSQYQCVVRKQIEIFEAGSIDVDTNAQGRNKPIVIGQAGIRCLHCSMIHPKRRARGGTYYPSKFSGFYQAAQNMASGHLCEHCPHVPEPLRRQLHILRERKSSAGGGKDYWAEGIKSLGVIEDTVNGILRFRKENEEIDEGNQEQKKSDDANPDPGDT